MKRGTKIPNPPVLFAENIGRLTQLMRARGITVGEGLTADELQAMREEQAKETQDDTDRGREWQEQHRSFLLRQAARFGRFMKALEATRSLLRDDPLAQKSLVRLGGHGRRNRTTKVEDAS